MAGIKYIHDHYDCEKLIITNAVCPLATSEQYDKYFRLLDEYDFVLTTWKLAPALQHFDGTRVDRDDYFNVMEPDAYRFKMLWDSILPPNGGLVAQNIINELKNVLKRK